MRRHPRRDGTRRYIRPVQEDGYIDVRMTDAATTPELAIVPANEASWEDLQAVLGTGEVDGGPRERTTDPAAPEASAGGSPGRRSPGTNSVSAAAASSPTPG